MLELKSLQEEPVEGSRITLVDEHDLYSWEVASSDPLWKVAISKCILHFLFTTYHITFTTYLQMLDPNAAPQH